MKQPFILGSTVIIEEFPLQYYDYLILNDSTNMTDEDILQANDYRLKNRLGALKCIHHNKRNPNISPAFIFNLAL
jgi:hypothetical protein